MPETLTARTKRYFEERGYLVGVVERWIPQARRRVDLFGFADIVVVGWITPTTYVQVTSGGNHAARIKKILSLESARRVLNEGNYIVVMSWSKRGPRGRRKVWTPRWDMITPRQFEEASRDGISTNS